MHDAAQHSAVVLRFSGGAHQQVIGFINHQQCSNSLIIYVSPVLLLRNRKVMASSCLHMTIDDDYVR